MWSSLWFIPVLCVLGGLVISIVTLAVDRATGFDVIPRWLTGGPDAAIAILTTIAVSMVSLAALVLTITMVVVQLAMGQFSPRIVQTFLRDKPSQLAIGLFVATFAHAMVAMREVRFDGEGQVPGLAVAVGYVLVLTSIAMLVLYVNHIGRSLRVSALIELVGNDTRRMLDEQYPNVIVGDENDDVDLDVVTAPKSGVVVSIDRDRLVELAIAANCVVHVQPAIGTFVPAGAPLLCTHDGLERVRPPRLRRDPHRRGAITADQQTTRGGTERSARGGPAGRRPVVAEQLELLRERVDDVPQDERERIFALSPDAQGIGVAAGNGATRAPSTRRITRPNVRCERANRARPR
ncbi:MAG: DUF2254 domain-containing protein [Ilumatobacteraceae bacterium]